MDRVKKNIKRIWNSKCKYLVIVACALILLNGVNLLQTSLKLINSDGEEVSEKKSIEIVSDTWESKGSGSFKVTKSAEWTGFKKATIKFDVETNGKPDNKTRDVILVLDTSGSMGSKVNGKQKLVSVQEDAIDLVNFLLTVEGNSVAVISFGTSATLRSDFTNDKNKAINAINGLSLSGGTSFPSAYKAVINLLSEYEQNKDKELVMLFLTDGLGGNAKAQYSILKEQYNITIVGIQYELGTSMKQAIIDISDEQYIANTVNLKSIFYEATGVGAYEEFEITDYITKEFSVENISDIRVSRGEVKIETDSSGNQKVIWKIPTSDVKFITNFGATMEIDIIYKGELKPDRLIATNIKEGIRTKLPGESEKNKKSEETPEIRGGYYVTYYPNLPSGCNSSGEDLVGKKAYFAYEKVDMFYGNYTCSGWQFKGWEFSPEIADEITRSSNNQFVMLAKDITLTAVWTKMDLTKKMEGTIYDVPKKDLVEAMKENAGTSISLDIGFVFGKESSASNGRGLYIRDGTESDTNPIYYYRGNVSNNNVLFAGICWQIVRTTETGGIKLVYNGVSMDGRSCQNTGDSFIAEDAYGSKKFSVQSIENVGYMTGDIEKHNDGEKFLDGSYVYGKSITYDYRTNQYTLLGTRSISSSYTDQTINRLISDYKYTCFSNSTTCENVFYVYEAKQWNDGSRSLTHISLSNGQTIKEALEERFNNEYDSNAKKIIDSWYKENIGNKGYTKYLDQNIAFCSDRTIVSGGLYLNNPNPEKENLFTSIGSRHLNGLKEGVSGTIQLELVNPSLDIATICPNENDRFTTSTMTIGNKALTYPVGMLTADEVVFAGISSSANKDSYLATDYTYWTMTPAYNSVGAGIFAVSSGGSLSATLSYSSSAIRPSISLKSGTKVYITEADGTLEHPYEVVTE